MAIEIQLGSKKNVNAVNVDQNINIELKNSTSDILSYDESNVISVSQLFNSERQESESYRVYGAINFLSIINGIKKSYSELTNFFTPPRLGDELNGLTKNLPYCFDLYLCYPLNNAQISGETFIRNYTVITKLNNAEIYKSGFASTIYYNNQYCYDFNIDFDLYGILDSFKKPVTNLYLFLNYKPTSNGASQLETVLRKNYTGTTVSVPYVQYNQGDIVTGDLVNYVNLNFEETLSEQMEYYVNFPYDTGSLQFKYNPFINIKIKDYSDEISYGNLTGGTETDLNIPSYATPIDNSGNVIWKIILENGYIDPINGKGVDFPFVNKRHYVFNVTTFPLRPNLNDPATELIFNDINFNTNTGQYVKPTTKGSLNNLGNKCA
jgi:hypothetical protein